MLEHGASGIISEMRLPKSREQADLEAEGRLPDTRENKELRRKFHVRQLKTPAMQAYFKFLRRTPHLWDQVLARYENRDKFNQVAHEVTAEADVSTVTDDERIQHLVPLWSAAATVPEANAYLEIMLDEATREKSAEIKREMHNGEKYVPTLIVGGGVHGAVYNAEFLYHAPNVENLTIDAAEHLGGQFRSYGGPVLAMNTSNRKINVDRPESLDNPNSNSMGPHAPLQLPDISGRLYADNTRVGLVAAVNQFLSADTAIETELTGVKKSTELETSGSLIVSLRDFESTTDVTTTTDKLVISTGLGHAELAFTEQDEKTKEICCRSEKCVYTYTELLELIGDRSNPFPLEKFSGKRIIFVGGGHSALTGVEAMVGLGPEDRGSVASLGGPSEITIIGTKYDRAETFRKEEIARYAQLESLMRQPSPSVASLPRLIRPIAGTKAVRLSESQSETDIQKTGKGIQVYCKRRKEIGDTFIDEEMTVEGDIVIVTTGFNNRYKEIFRELIGVEQAENPNLDFSTLLEDVYVEGNEYPVARSLKGASNIVFVGPAAGMPTSAREKAIAEHFGRATNPVALPNTVDDTRAYARASAAIERSQQRTKAEKLLVPSALERNPKKLGAVEANQQEAQRFFFEIPREIREQKFPPEIRYEDLLHLAVLRHCEKYRSAEATQLKIRVARNNGRYEMTTTVPIDQGYREFLDTFVQDELAQAALAKLTEERHRRSNKVAITFSISAERPRK